MKYFNKIKKSIKEGKLSEAINLLEEMIEKEGREIQYDSILIIARYNKLNKEEILGLVTREEANIEYNRINNSILELLESIEGGIPLLSQQEIEPQIKSLINNFELKGQVILNEIEKFKSNLESNKYKFIATNKKDPIKIDKYNISHIAHDISTLERRFKYLHELNIQALKNSNLILAFNTVNQIHNMSKSSSYLSLTQKLSDLIQMVKDDEGYDNSLINIILTYDDWQRNFDQMLSTMLNRFPIEMIIYKDYTIGKEIDQLTLNYHFV